MKLTAKDKKGLTAGGEMFFAQLVELSLRPDVQKGASNLAALMSWAKDSEKFNNALVMKYSPLALLAMGIVIGTNREFPEFPFTAKRKGATAGK